MRFTQLLSFLLLATVLHMPMEARADRRSFVWNYEARTMPAGDAELEYYLTGSILRAAGVADDTINFDHELEIEYGITDNFDVGVYQIFRQREDEDFSYRGYKLRGRYRISDYGRYFVDPLLYIEFIHKPPADEVEFEEKIVLAKNIKSFIASFNMTFEQELKYKDNSQEYLFKPGFALGYQFHPSFILGLEAESRLQTNSPGGFDHHAFLLGPTISLAGQSVWWNLGVLVQATKTEEPRYQIRSLMGLHF